MKSQKRNLVSNSISMLINRLAQSITTFVLTAAIARNLGGEALGEYLLAFSYYFVFMTIASQGLKTLFTRELALKPEKIPVYLISGTGLQLIFSLLSYVLLVILVFLLPYSSETSNVCYIMGLTVIPFSLSNITEAVFQAKEKMHFIAISTVPVYIIRLFVMIWTMFMKLEVIHLAVIFFCSEIIIMMIEWIIITRIVKPKWQIDREFIWQTIKNVRTFFAIEGVAVVNQRMQIFILSLLGNELMVGIYGGIVQLLQPFLIIANSIATAVFPSLSKTRELGKEKQRQLVETFIEVLLMIALPLFVGLLCVGKELLTFIYNPSFAQGSVALSISAAVLLFSPFNRSLSFLLVANGFEKVNLQASIINTIIVNLLGIVLVLQYKLLGAAVILVLTSFVGAGQFLYYTYTRIFTLRLWRISRYPILVSILMLPVFLILQNSNLDFALVLIVATSIYSLIVGYIGIHAVGGYRVVLSKLRKNS